MDILNQLPGDDPKTNLMYAAVGTVLTLLSFGIKEKLSAANQNDSKRTKNEKLDSVSRGADSVVSTAERLLSLLERQYEQEMQHRKTCEESLAEIRKEVEELKRTKMNKTKRTIENTKNE